MTPEQKTLLLNVLQAILLFFISLTSYGNKVATDKQVALLEGNAQATSKVAEAVRETNVRLAFPGGISLPPSSHRPPPRDVTPVPPPGKP